ncbi:MAG: hypothetical protein ABSC64_00785 [Candidatus Korobacteraceae bacterium]|jgi:hypothetical protein
MEYDELARTFIELLSAYKRLLIDHKTLKFIHDHPGMDLDQHEVREIREKFLDEVHDAFEPIETALVEGKPLRDALRHVLEKS